MSPVQKNKQRKAVPSRDESFSIVICGAAGSGIQTVEKLLIEVFKAGGFHVFAMKEYMSRIRGGSNSTEIRLSSRPIAAPVRRIDLAVPLDQNALGHIEDRLSPGALILGEKAASGASRSDMVDVPFSRLALEAGNKLYANNIAVSVIAAMLGVDQEVILDCVKKHFAKKSPEIISGNCEAVKKGYAFARQLLSSGQVKQARFPVFSKALNGNEKILITGSQAISLGALAAGCNFISAYPMSPGTGVLTFLSVNAQKFNVVAEQAEDEIAAINMAIGASYAGSRAMVTTSGGGFALMEEGVSLAGMIETPVVIHVAQRPGPATGLPTRTEQGDLDLVLYSGHGYFSRAIFAPGDPQQAFDLTQRAFAAADKFQSPVFILSDQHLVDSSFICSEFEVQNSEIKPDIIKTDKDYKRYALTKDGISPRGIPGHGEGLILVDSDEHDEWGRITESMEVRRAMVEKRLKKMISLKKAAIAPTFLGPKTYKNLIVCWGSNLPIAREAWEKLARPDTAFLHFGQVYPVPVQAGAYLKKAKRTIVVENNVTGQFAKLLQEETGCRVTDKVLKSDGLPFFVDELTDLLAKVLKKPVK